jgi:hypothetical protein
MASVGLAFPIRIGYCDKSRDFFLGRNIRNLAGNRKFRYPTRKSDTGQNNSVGFEFRLQFLIKEPSIFNERRSSCGAMVSSAGDYLYLVLSSSTLLRDMFFDHFILCFCVKIIIIKVADLLFDPKTYCRSARSSSHYVTLAVVIEYRRNFFVSR